MPFDIRWLFGGQKDAEAQKSYLESMPKGEPFTLTIDPAKKPEDVLGPSDIVAISLEDYWYTCGMPPMWSEVCTLRRSMPEVAIGDRRTFMHLGESLMMECVEMTSETVTFREIRIQSRETC